MTVLITGASGLIGSHLCRALSANGADVIALTHQTKNPVLSSIPKNSIEITPCDIRDRANLDLVFRYYQPDAVFHLAAALPYDVKPDYHEVNMVGSRNVLELSRGYEVKQFIFSSSMSVYTRPQYLPVDEEHPVVPKTTYGEGKLQVERMIPEFGIPYTIIRYAGVYGVGQKNGRAVGTFVQQALAGEPIVVNGDGSQSSDFISVHDAVDGTIRVLGRQGTFNIGSGQEMSLLGLAQMVVRLTGSKSEIVLDGGAVDRPFRFVADIGKARRELGFNPSGIEDGLRKYIEEIKENEASR